MKTTFTTNKLQAVAAAALLGFTFMASSCGDSGADQRRKDVAEFNTYVDEHKNSADRYADQKWEDMDREYNEKKMKLEKDQEKMDQEMKERYNRSQQDWEAFKTDYTSRHEAAANQEKMTTFRTSLMPSEVNGDMANVTGSNIAKVYDHFVTTVDNNKKTYTQEQWKAISECMDQLDAQKDNLDKSKAISKNDEAIIAKKKFTYAGIMSTYKPFSDTNAEKAKEKHDQM